MKIVFRLHLFEFYILKVHVYCSLLESNQSFSDSAVWLLWCYTLQEKAPCYWNFTASCSQVAPGIDSVTFVLKSFYISSLKRERKFRWMYLTFWGHFYMSSWISRIPLSSWLLPLSPCRWSMKITENCNDIERSAYWKQYLRLFYYRRYMLHESKTCIFTAKK